MMKAIYRGKLYYIAEDTAAGVILDDENSTFVDYGDTALIVDPNDEQTGAALAGLPIPPDPADEEELAALTAKLLERFRAMGDHPFGWEDDDLPFL